MASVEISTDTVEKEVTKVEKVIERTIALTLSEPEAEALFGLISRTPCGDKDLYWDIYQALSGRGIAAKPDVPEGKSLTVEFKPRAGW